HDADVAAAEFIEYVRGELDAHRAEPRDDLLTHMLEAEIDGERLSEGEIVATAILLLNAGHEATVHTTGHVVRRVLEHPDRAADWLGDPDVTATLIEACLRYDSPLHLFTRYALEDVDLGHGLTIAAGEQVGLLLGAANRDPFR